jgi:hypothetical protein
MLAFLTVIVSVPNALPETVTLWFCSKMASHSARADQLPANAHSTPRPRVAPKLLLLPVLVKAAGSIIDRKPLARSKANKPNSDPIMLRKKR